MAAADPAVASDAPERPADRAEAALDAPIENVDAPLYSPFTARYILDEVRRTRSDFERVRAELIERQVAREYEIAKDAAGYARNAVELFFFIITAVTTLLVFLGWNSLREVRVRVREIAEERVESIVAGYSKRLDDIEKELERKSSLLRDASVEIELTNEVHSLWLRASQEPSPSAKIAIYDEILRLRPGDIEALTFKADAALQLGEPQWALSLANQAISISGAAEGVSAHSLYQRACARAAIGSVDEAFSDLASAISAAETYRDQARIDPAFDTIRSDERFAEIVAAGS